MTGKEAIEKLKECNTGDIEADHCNADDILCNLLADIGYDDVVKEYLKIEKWYA